MPSCACKLRISVQKMRHHRWENAAMKRGKADGRKHLLSKQILSLLAYVDRSHARVYRPDNHMALDKVKLLCDVVAQQRFLFLLSLCVLVILVLQGPLLKFSTARVNSRAFVNFFYVLYVLVPTTSFFAAGFRYFLFPCSFLSSA